MPHRFAASLALVAFAGCLLIGAFQANNTFGTSVLRALAALAGTYVLGLVLGAMGRSALSEAGQGAGEKREDSRTKAGADDR